MLLPNGLAYSKRTKGCLQKKASSGPLMGSLKVEDLQFFPLRYFQAEIFDENARYKNYEPH